MSAEAAILSAALPALPAAQAYHPTTFLERGLAVPFTTPALQGARARPAERIGLEIVVPNPSGGRGVYILPWSGVCELCRPTVHDTLLSQRVAALASVSPGSIRAAARDIAAEGMAGRDAADGARAAAEADQRDRLIANFHLLLALIAQVEPGELADMPTEAPRSAELEQRARRAVVRIGPKLGRTPDSVAEALEELAQAFAGIGSPSQKPLPRVPRLLAALGRLREDMLIWSRGPSGDSSGWAEMIGTVAGVTVACAERTLADAHAMTRDMGAMLRGWSAGPAALGARIARPEWLLDGWEQICLVWHCAPDDGARRAVLPEMAQMIPVLPRETAGWVGTQIDIDAAVQFRRTVRQNEDWRTGVTLDRIVRNEALRALAV